MEERDQGRTVILRIVCPQSRTSPRADVGGRGWSSRHAGYSIDRNQAKRRHAHAAM